MALIRLDRVIDRAIKAYLENSTMNSRYMFFHRIALLLIGLTVAPYPAEAASMTCPSTFPTGNPHQTLNGASLFDGPPTEMADQIPEEAGDIDTWPLTGVDPYFVCRYAGTSKVITFHATGARVCKATPTQAFCR